MDALRPPAETRFADELLALAAVDRHPRPPGWRLSPRAVRAFLCGSQEPLVRRKFFGDDSLVERAVVTLAGNRGLMLVGDPGTAKTMLSELLTAAISGTSLHTLQGTAGTVEDQVKYSWNYALLLAEGPSRKALVPSPLYDAMSRGEVFRFEEITRCPPEVQDVLVSVLSDKVLMVPELEGPDRVLLARPGFNVVGSANLRDRGVNEMSSALKRRFNFETVRPLRDLEEETRLVTEECRRLLAESEAPVEIAPDVVGVLVQAFQDLRDGVTAEGIRVERPAAVMSTAEAVSVAMAAGLDAFHFGDRRLRPVHLARHFAGAVLKDDPADHGKLRHYLDTVVRKRGGLWKEFLQA